MEKTSKATEDEQQAIVISKNLQNLAEALTGITSLKAELEKNGPSQELNALKEFEMAYEQKKINLFKMFRRNKHVLELLEALFIDIGETGNALTNSRAVIMREDQRKGHIESATKYASKVTEGMKVLADISAGVLIALKKSPNDGVFKLLEKINDVAPLYYDLDAKIAKMKNILVGDEEACGILANFLEKTPSKFIVA